MDCLNCGAANTDNSNFCRQCGVRLRLARSVAPVADLSSPPGPDDSEVSRLLDRAFGLCDEKNYSEAFEVCRAALRLNPDSGAGHSLLASIYEKQGNLEAAIRQMRRVTDLNPESQADKERLAHMEQRLQFLQADEDFTPARSSFNLGAFLSNPRVLAVTSLVLVTFLAAWLFSTHGEETQPATAPPPEGPTAIAPRTPLFEPENTAQSATAGGLFAGGEVNSSPEPPPPPVSREPSPQPRTATDEPRRPEQAGAPSTAQPAARPPIPAPPAPRAPTPSVRITRTPAPTPAPAPAPVTTARVTGSEYQRLAREAQDNGDKNSARDYYTKAIAAYRAEAGSGGGAFVAQQGIRSSELALKLLDSAE